MNIKVNENGTMSFTYDGTSIGTISNVCDTAYSMTYTFNDLQFSIDKLTKKPEVRKDQRSALEVKGRRVIAQYYKDGFFTDSKDLIPEIKSIEVFNENTIKMTFVNGDIQTATVQSGDPYFFEDGLLRCIVKEMIGKEGTAILSKLLSYAIKVHRDAENSKIRKELEEIEKKAISEKNYRKMKKRWDKKRAKEREARIEEMAAAIVRAEEMKKNV